jgi:hypothetical protein
MTTKKNYHQATKIEDLKIAKCVPCGSSRDQLVGWYSGVHGEGWWCGSCRGLDAEGIGAEWRLMEPEAAVAQ